MPLTFKVIILTLHPNFEEFKNPMENTYKKTFIELALQCQALRFGEWKLKSGRLSPYFFNMGHIASGKALHTLGTCYAKAIESQPEIKFNLLFGPAYKGIPLVCTTAVALSTLYKKDIPFAFNRKEVKDHGEGGNLIGAPLQGSVLLLDDVITAGTAIREAIQLIQQHGARLGGIVVALDRQEKGLQQSTSALEDLEMDWQVPVVSIISLNDIMEFVTAHPEFSKYATSLEHYRQQYGILTSS